MNLQSMVFSSKVICIDIDRKRCEIFKRNLKTKFDKHFFSMEMNERKDYKPLSLFNCFSMAPSLSDNGRSTISIAAMSASDSSRIHFIFPEFISKFLNIAVYLYAFY